MTFFVINIILAFVWAGLLGRISLGSLLSGYLIGYAILFAFSSSPDARQYLRKFPRAISFVIYYLVEMLRANLQIAFDLLRPRPRFKPGFVKVPLSLNTDVGITLLSNLVTMTPGTMTVDVSEDRCFMLVHGLYMGEPDSVIRDIKNNLEQRIIELLHTES